MVRSRSRDDELSERRRPRSRSPSDSEEERRRQRRRREREDRSESPRDRRRDNKYERNDKYDSRDRRDKLRDDDRHRESSDSDRRHRDGDRHTSDRRTHDRRTHREGDRHHESRHRRRNSRSPRRRHSRSPRRRSREREEEPKKIEAYKKASGPLPDQQAAFRGGASGSEMVPHQGEPEIEKQVPNFAPTGLLAAATNTIEKSDGTKIVLKYHEPPEARKPSSKDGWKLFIFKGADIIDTIPVAERSCWLIGKEVAVVDLLAEHPTISRQHAVIQFRYVEKKNEFGDRVGKVNPYLLDLESANGTFLNGERIEDSRFIEIRDKDLIKFGESTREYVVMLPPKD